MQRMTEIKKESGSIIKLFRKNGIYCNYTKRLMDFIFALFALIVLSPILLVCIISVGINLGRPVIFKQKRPGLNEKIFTLYKFRTMTDQKDSNGKFLPDEIRLTKLGRFLRATSMDELPELINIIKGDMSFIGPRPLLVEYLPLYNDHQRRRHDVRPGLSGLAQVNGRNSISWEDKFSLDVKYVETINFVIDLKLVLKTIFKVFKQEGISSDNNVTMEPFKGTADERVKI